MLSAYYPTNLSRSVAFPSSIELVFQTKSSSTQTHSRSSNLRQIEARAQSVAEILGAEGLGAAFTGDLAERWGARAAAQDGAAAAALKQRAESVAAEAAARAAADR